MQTVVLISCGKTKKNLQCKAENMYISNRFQLAKEYSTRISSNWFIISAKYGLLEPEREIKPYDVWLGNFSNVEKQAWCDKVKKSLHGFSRKTKFVILLNDLYAQVLIQLILETGHEFSWPIRNMESDEVENYFMNRLNEVDFG